jgi:hypothetical protein
MPGLLDVADYLSDRAKKLGGDEADLFGRSAFNRYYYACFLTVRDLLAKLDEAWARQPHSNIPDLLEGKVIKRMKESARQQHKAGIISEKRSKSVIHEASSAASDIASVLKVAYSVRVTADYDPNQSVTLQQGTLWLIEHSDAEARNWKVQVEQRKSVLLRISKELGIVA